MKKIMMLLLCTLFMLCLVSASADTFTRDDVVGLWISYTDSPSVDDCYFVRMHVFDSDSTYIDMNYSKLFGVSLYLDNQNDPSVWVLDGNTIHIYSNDGLEDWYFEIVDDHTLVFYDSTWKVTYKKMEKMEGGQVWK